MKRFYAEDIDSLLRDVNTTREGLTDTEALERLKKYGKNELPKKKPDGIIKIFFRELLDPIVLILLVAIIASLVIGEKVDAIAISFIVLIDLLMGTFQENKANHTAMALSNLVKEKVKVLRNNKEVEIESNLLVVGDIIILSSGDKIGADVRLIEAHNFTVDESILTGESLPVEKDVAKLVDKDLSITDQNNMVFAGTSVITGRAIGVVVGTAITTEIGKIADTLNKTKEEKSPLTIRVEEFSKQITFIIIGIAIVITLLLFSKGISYNEIFLSVIALSVSAMPEGLPLALTMALTIASNKMAKKKVIAKKLHSVESLGSVTVIATDKTGTLTANEQTAKKILLPNGNTYDITGSGYNVKGEVVGKELEFAKEIALLGVINNEARFTSKEHFGDSIDMAFLVLGEKLNLNKEKINIIEVIPYESQNKYSAVFYEKDGDIYCTIKGSLEKVLDFCSSINLLDRFSKNKLIKQNEDLANSGYRVIALADGKVKKKDKYSEEDIKDLTFMGMVGFIDPIRKEVISSIKECRNAGIKVLMITGDHPLTAFAIAKELKLTDNYKEVATGIDVEKYYSMGEVAFDKFISSKKVFSRVAPLQKLQIVESLKRQKEFVAVTGDGVNDAPALKSANIGVAMGSGTDIARETANMIIIDDNFKSIVNGVKEGRIAYSNIRKIAFFLISCGLAEVLFFLLSTLFNMPMPLLAIQLLWLNIVTDGLQDFALSFEKGEDNIMKEAPRDPKESLFDKTLFSEIAFSGITIGLIVFIIWFYLIKNMHMDVLVARGYIMALMVFIQNIHVFNCRSEKKSAFLVPLKKNFMILLAVFGSIFLQILVMEVPFLAKLLKTTAIPFIHLVFLFALSLFILIIMEIYKTIKYKND